jgi:hypothetical protein
VTTRRHTPDAGRADGERAKASALALLEARREVFILRGRRALLTAMLTGDGTATADDVRAAVDLPADMDPRCLGTVPGRLGYDRIIRAAGFVRSGRPQRHASYIQRWALADRGSSRLTRPGRPGRRRARLSLPSQRTDPDGWHRRGRTGVITP